MQIPCGSGGFFTPVSRYPKERFYSKEMLCFLTKMRFVRTVAVILGSTPIGFSSPPLRASQGDVKKPEKQLCPVDINVRAFDASQIAPSDVFLIGGQGAADATELHGQTDSEGNLKLRAKSGAYYLRVTSRGFRVYEKHPVSIQCDADSSPQKLTVKMEVGETR